MKRSFALTFCVVLMLSLFCGFAKAATYSSDYLDAYEASLSTGSRSGQLTLNFQVYTSGGPRESVGISSIAVYTAEGSYVKTINGSTSNGLLASQTFYHSGAYTISATPGQEYYLRLIFSARDSNGGDSKSYTTNTAMAAR